MTIRVRTAQAGDMAALRRIYRAASLSNQGDRPHLLAHPEVLEFAGDGVTSGRTVVAELDGDVAGFATHVVLAGVVELEDLFVDPALMRRGVASQLVAEVAARVRSLGVGPLEVTANPHASAFYAQAGFVPYGTVATPFGQGCRMRLGADPVSLGGSPS